MLHKVQGSEIKHAAHRKQANPQSGVWDTYYCIGLVLLYYLERVCLRQGEERSVLLSPLQRLG